MKGIIPCLLLLISVKITAIHHGKGDVVFWFPMHYLEITATLDQESMEGLNKGEFYEADFDHKNRLIVRAKQKGTKRRIPFIVKKISFQGN